MTEETDFKRRLEKWNNDNVEWDDDDDDSIDLDKDDPVEDD